MVNKILIFAILIIGLYSYLKFARSPLFKKKRIVNGYEQYRAWWGRWKFTHIYNAEKKVGGKIFKGHVVHAMKRRRRDWKMKTRNHMIKICI